MTYRIGALIFTAVLGAQGETWAQNSACVPDLGDAYVGSVPPNLRMAPACPRARRMGKGEVYWVFLGKVTLTGEIRATLGEWGTTYLHPNAKTRGQLPSGVDFVQLDDRNEDRALRIPAVGAEEACFETTGTVEFAELSVLSDGTDESGNWVRKYKVLSIGKWRECRAQ